MKLTFFNSKKNKMFLKVLEDQFGIVDKVPYVLAMSEKDNVYAADESIKELDLEELNIHSVGAYIGEWRHDGFRPSIEGSKLLAAKKNVLEVDEKIARMWMYGLDIPCSEEIAGWVIIKCGDDFLGSGKFKEGKILNHVPKGRRIHE